MYGIAHFLMDRDGHAIGRNLPIGNGASAEQSRTRAALMLRQIYRREPGEDDE